MSDVAAHLQQPWSCLFPAGDAWLDEPAGLLAYEPVRVEVAEAAGIPAPPSSVAGCQRDVGADGGPATATAAAGPPSNRAAVGHPATGGRSVTDVLAAVDEELAQGRWVTALVSYEAGAAFDLQTHPPSDLAPLAAMAAYDPEHVVRLATQDLPDLPVHWDSPEMRLNVSRERYTEAIARIHEYIACGDTYQVNYTCHTRFQSALEPLAYFLAMVRRHPVPYSCYFNLGERQVLSLSPELFLQQRGGIISSRPMKGTRKRGATPEEDEALREDLVTSLKDRAENLMILDMVRNDLGRIARIGSVRVPEMFTAEPYGTVWQMTSTVECEPLPGMTLTDLFAATFPGASITGAPKRRTMEIIHELEAEARGLYTGAIGLFSPDGDFTCSLPIRTLIHRDGDYDLGIGAGILWDSRPESEYEETLLKARFAYL